MVDHPRPYRGSGLIDKLYWRLVPGDMEYHCFKRLAGKIKGQRAFGSLCGRREIPRSYGGDTRRPPPHMRCSQCDSLEMRRRGADESMPETFDPNAEE